MPKFWVKIIALLLFFPASVLAAGEKNQPAIAAVEPAVIVDMTNALRFNPETVTIDAGQTVKWTNSSFTAHTVTAIPTRAKDPKDVQLPTGAQPFGSGKIEKGQTYSHTFTVPGLYRYFCIPHEFAGMIGEVIVKPTAGPATSIASTAPATTGIAVATSNSTATTAPMPGMNTENNQTPELPFVLGAHLPPRAPDYQNATGILKFIYWLGNFHPPATDLPVGTILAAFLSEMLLIKTGNLVFSSITRFCVWIGGLAALGTAILGWFLAGFHIYDHAWLLLTHRILGSTTGAWGIVLIIIMEVSLAKGTARGRWIFRAALLIAVMLIIATGFFGGAMIYGIDHYAWH